MSQLRNLEHIDIATCLITMQHVAFYDTDPNWTRPEQVNESRPAYDVTIEEPGADVAAAAAAALAATVVAFKGDKAYTGQLIDHAVELYTYEQNSFLSKTTFYTIDQDWLQAGLPFSIRNGYVFPETCQCMHSDIGTSPLLTVSHTLCRPGI